MNMKPQLNIEVIKSLYEFGGLYYYEVHRLDEIFFKTVVDLRTFNEQVAIDRVEWIKSQGGKAAYNTVLVKFDGAFCVNSN